MPTPNFNATKSYSKVVAYKSAPIAACGCDVLIEKLEKFTIQNVSLNAAIEENAAVEEECHSRRGLQ